MNILQVTEKKPVVYLCVLLYFVFLCVLFSQTNSSLVGFGFGFLWLMSLFTKNIVLCVTGSFVMICCLLVFFGRKEGFVNDPDRCNPTFFGQNLEILQMNDELSEQINTLNGTVSDLTTDKNTLTALNQQLDSENNGLKSSIEGLNAQNNSLNLDKMNLTASKENYRMLVENISRHSTST